MVNFLSIRKKLWLIILSLLCVDVIAQPVSVPKNVYTIECLTELDSLHRSPDTYFWLINKVSGKRTKIHPPVPGYVHSPTFITDYVIHFKGATTITEWQNKPTSNFLFVVKADTGTYLQGKTGSSVFSSARTTNCFIMADKDLFLSNGNQISSNYWYTPKSKSIEIQCMDCTDKAEMRRYYLPDCKKTNFTMLGATKVYDLGNHVAYFWSDTLFFYDLINDKEKGPFRTIPLQVRDMFYKANTDPAIDKLIEKEKKFPVQPVPGKWTFINDVGEMLFKPIQADLLLPIIFSQQQAPIHFNNKWGVISADGQMNYPFQFDSLSLGKNQTTTYFFRNDSSFIMNSEGVIVSTLSKGAVTSSSNQTKPTKKYESTCLVYVYENSDKKILEEQKAYILVNLSYDKNNVNHAKMVDWTAKAISSEQSALLAKGYYSMEKNYNNSYHADIVKEGTGCYHLESDYKQKSRLVSVFEKTFE